MTAPDPIRKHWIKSLLLLMVTANSLLAMSSAEKKIDSLIGVIHEYEQIVQRVDPLHDKKFGLEINPITPLLAGGEMFFLTGGFQIFKLSRSAEFSIPFQIIHNNKHKFHSLDFHYRRFLGMHQKGMYVSWFVRNAWLEIESPYDDIPGNDFRDYRFGGGAGLGYRVYSTARLYWGWSLNAGRYLVYNNHHKHSYIGLGTGDFGKFIFDIEFFKIGISF